MATEPLVSVVIPAYNAAATVGATLESVLAQTVDDLEVIVVDDGSSDDTAAVVHAIDDPRVRLIEKPNGGASDSRNAGIAEATGRYVAFLDADDLWVPDKLERQLDWLASNPGVGAVQTGVRFVDDELNTLDIRRCRPSEDALLETLQFENLPGFNSTLLVERELLERLGRYDTSLAILEDWNLAIELAKEGNLGGIEEPLALYRQHPGNRSRNLEIHVEPGFIVLGRLFADPATPERIRAKKGLIYGRFFTMLAGGAFRNRQWRDWLRWTLKAVRADPRTLKYMAALPMRRRERAQ
jgi:glycosyltransferase involved in cell wall biosynthesis